MRSRPKQTGLSDAVASGVLPAHREIYRELCQDEDGNPYVVIVYRPFPHLSVTDYALEDGTPVRLIDDCVFEIESTGQTLTRCDGDTPTSAITCAGSSCRRRYVNDRTRYQLCRSLAQRADQA